MNADRSSANAAPVRLSAVVDFRLGHLHVRPSACEIMRNGERRHIEPRVMQVLVALARADGAAVSRDELIQSCWDARVVGEAAIHRCISKLREFADGGAGRVDFEIETIARVGYRLTAARAHEQAIDGTPVAAGRSKAVQLGIVAIAAACLAVAFIASTLRQDPSTAQSSAPHIASSIAVMPFQNFSADPDAAFFAGGLRDEVLTRLARIGALRVISRTSTDRMAERADSLRETARQLGVTHVVEGSVQRAGNTVRINVQLIRIAGEDHSWAESYDRTLDDVLSAENDVADAIATSIAAKMAPGEGNALVRRSPPDPYAHELYLQGLVQFREAGAGDYKAAADALRRAVAKDPSFAMAWALLSRANAQLYFGDARNAERDEARSALDKALALEPASLETGLARAFYEYHVEHDYRSAAIAFEALSAKWPNNVEVLQSYGFVTRRLGRWDESIGALGEVVRLDPLVPNNYILLAETLALHREPSKAIEVLDAALRLWPGDTGLLTRKICALQSSGQLERADVEIARLHPARLDPYVLSMRRKQYAMRREFAEGLRYFESIRALPEIAGWNATDRAALDIILGDFRRETGDADGARDRYEAALRGLETMAESEPGDSELQSLLGIVYSGLGDETEALRHANRASSSHQFAADPIGSADSALSRATALARLGDADAAIPALAQLVAGPSNLTVDVLRLDPDFDRLRGDSRFASLVAKD
jgi:TolB-like protein/DNA-binding winged helix-turn-helix (wHTH) protein/Tfp pilus assembly protein PilF